MIFKDRPNDFNSSLDVVGCYVEHDGKFLILQRHSKQSHSNKWCQPAGKVDAGENIHLAMRRELNEETGLVVDETDLKFLAPVYVVKEGKNFIFHAFKMSLAQKPEIKLNPYEHVSHRWISPKEALDMTEVELIHDFQDTMRLFYDV